MTSLQSRMLAAAVFVAVLLIVALLAIHLWTKARTAGTEAKVSKGQAEASIESGADAMNTVSGVAKSDQQTDELVKEGTSDILKSPPGNSNSAALRAACKLRQYRDSERCAALRQTGTAQPVGAR